MAGIPCAEDESCGGDSLRKAYEQEYRGNPDPEGFDTTLST